MTSQDPTIDRSLPAQHGVADDFAALRHDFNRLSETVAHLVKHQAESAGHSVMSAVESMRDNISTTAVHARDAISHTAGQATEKAIGFTEELEASIERNPLTAVLLALGIGVVAGLLTTSRR